MPESPELVEHRTTETNPVAMLFVHGFSGDPTKTWGKFPAFLMGERRLSGWDVYSLGYHTGLSLDVVGLWRANPGLTLLAGLLATRAALEPLKRYKSLALIAHSMGGLVAQRAILDNPGLRSRARHGNRTSATIRPSSSAQPQETKINSCPRHLPFFFFPPPSEKSFAVIIF